MREHFLAKTSIFIGLFPFLRLCQPFLHDRHLRATIPKCGFRRDISFHRVRTESELSSFDRPTVNCRRFNNYFHDGFPWYASLDIYSIEYSWTVKCQLCLFSYLSILHFKHQVDQCWLEFLNEKNWFDFLARWHGELVMEYPFILNGGLFFKKNTLSDHKNITLLLLISGRVVLV